MGRNLVREWETPLSSHESRSACSGVAAHRRNQQLASGIRNSRLVSRDAYVESVPIRADIIHGQSRAWSQSLLHSEVPLVGIRILDLRIDKPVVLLKRRRQRSGVGALQRVLGEDAGRRVYIVERQNELIGARPCSLLVLGHLQNRSPVVIEATVGTTQDSLVPKSVGDPNPRLNIVVSVGPEAGVSCSIAMAIR